MRIGYRLHPAGRELMRNAGGSPREGRSARLLRTAFERWGRGDYEPRPSEFHPDVEIVSRISGRALRGHGGIRRWIGDLNRAFDPWHASLDEVHEISENRLVAVGRLHLRGRQTGVDLDQPCAFVVDFRDGRIARVEVVPNRVDEVLAAYSAQPRS